VHKKRGFGLEVSSSRRKKIVRGREMAEGNRDIDERFV